MNISDLSKSLRDALQRTMEAELKADADRLAARIKLAAPVYRGPAEAGVQSGALRDSVRVSVKDSLHISVLAGGPTTTHGGYDYARAVEFGTERMSAEPFFFNTFRAMKNQMRTDMKNKLFSVINNYSDNSG